MSVHSTKVKIVGEEYTIRSAVPPEQTREVAAHVDAAIRTVLQSPTITDPGKAAILAGMSITDELFKARAENEALAAEIRALSSELRRWLPPGKRGESV